MENLVLPMSQWSKDILLIFIRPVMMGSVYVIYAGAQKNLGPAGFSSINFRGDLLDLSKSNCPIVFNY